MTITGGLVAAGVFGGGNATSETPTVAADRTGSLPPSENGALNPPPGAPLDHDAGDSSGSPSAAQLLVSPTPTATKRAGSSSQASTSPAPTATKKPSSSTADSAASPTATKKPASAASPAATKPAATATKAPPTVVPTATTVPPTLAPTLTPAPTQPPAPTQTPAPTQPPLPTPTKTPAPPTAVPTATTPPPPPQSVSLDSMEAAMFAAHNSVRAQVGAAPLAIDAQLVNVARQRSQTMANTNCFSHTACGPTAFDLLGGIGYFYQIAGENIARNNYPDSQTVDVAMNGFINSQGHYNNIVHTSYTKVGVGVAFGANGMKYFTVIFAGP